MSDVQSHRRLRIGRRTAATCMILVLIAVTAFDHGWAVAQKADGRSPNGQSPEKWVDEIEQIFIRSEECKQCHDRHYEEWKGAREQTPDLKTFGRVDAALLHGSSLESPVFRIVLGLWVQTNPTAEEQSRCLSCHAPAMTVFPRHAGTLMQQILAGK